MRYHMIRNALIMLTSIVMCLPTFQQVAAQSASFSEKADRDETIRIRNDDPVMAAAKKRARTELSNFIALAEGPPTGTRNFAIKIGIRYNETDAEFFWIRPFRRDGTRFVGRLNNEPRFVKTVKLHDMIAFEEKDIVDWYYFKNDAMVGNYTACALLTKEPLHERKQFMREFGLRCPSFSKPAATR